MGYWRPGAVGKKDRRWQSRIRYFLKTPDATSILSASPSIW